VWSRFVAGAWDYAVDWVNSRTFRGLDCNREGSAKRLVSLASRSRRYEHLLEPIEILQVHVAVGIEIERRAWRRVRWALPTILWSVCA